MPRRRPTLRRALVVAAGLVLLVGAGISVGRRVAERVPDHGVVWKDRPDLGQGWVVARVEPDGAGQGAGLRNGDRLVAVGSLPVRRALVAEHLMASAEPGLEVRLLIQRGARQLREVTLVPEGRATFRVLDGYLAVVGLLFLGAGLWAGLRRHPRRGLVVYTMLCWALGVLFTLGWTHRATPLDWIFYWNDGLARLAVPPLFLLFALTFSRIHRPSRGLLSCLALPPVLMLLTWFHLVARGGIYRFDQPIRAVESLRRVELGFLAAYLAVAVLVLGLSYARDRHMAYRVKLRWIFWGSTLGFGPFILMYLLPRALAVEVPSWATLSAIPLALVPFAYTAALLEYRLMDLQLFLRRGLAVGTTLALVVAVYMGVWVLLDRLLEGKLQPMGHIPALAAGLITGLLAPALRTAAQHLVGRLYYRDRYSFRRTLVSFGRELNAELDLDRLVERLRLHLAEGLGLRTVLVLLRDAPDESFVVWDKEHRGRRVPTETRMEERIREVSYLTVAELAAASEGAARPFRDLGLRYLVPMRLEGEVIAVLGLGGLRGGQPLDSEDLELLVALSSHAAAAFASARLIQQVRAKVAEVERLRTRTENIVDSSQIGILVYDESGVIRLWNPALERIYGLSPVEALGRRFADLFPLHLVRRVERAFRGEIEERGEKGRLYRVRLADRQGEGKVVNLALSELPGEEAGTARMVTFDDVTHQVTMEEQLLRNERLASIGLLAAGVAHEVNTPLTGISSYAQLLLEEATLEDPRRPLLDKIVGQSRRASSIANSLLNFTRSGGSDISPHEPVDLAALVDESVALLRPQIRKSPIQVECRISPRVSPVFGDRGKLQQVLLNLLLNARDALGGEGCILVILREERDNVILQVQDDGAGITEEDRGKIFDPFFTTKGRGKGTGLGLSLSHNIVVREFGGEIKVESEPGRGSTFTVVLPRRVPATAGSGAPREGPAGTPPSPDREPTLV